MTVVAIDKVTYRIVWTYYLIDVLPIWSLNPADITRILVSDMKPSGNGVYECKLIEETSVE